VHVTPDESAAGTSKRLGFSVRHGCDDSPTTSVVITIPEGGVGVTPVGAGADLDDALHPAVLQIAGQSVAVLAGSQIIPTGAWVARDGRPGIASGGGHTINAESRQLIDAVRKAKAANDVVLVVMHWGIEQDPCPEGVQRTLGRLLREAGATAVLGAHPHVLQPIVSDAVKRADGTVEQGLVAYSLGNFIWGPRSGASADTGVLELDFDGAQLVGHQLHPHRLDGNGWAAAVDPASADGRRIIARTTRRC
jgi:poly-gamma-glutamate synthesis protein (capsule biosynthesis protein)